jgi:toxin ParE1/3/4
MGQFILTEQAALDIDDIWEYVADSNIEAADKVISELYVAMRKLSDQPGMGRVRLELADETERGEKSLWHK